MTRVTIRLNDKLYSKLKREAAKRGERLSETIRFLLINDLVFQVQGINQQNPTSPNPDEIDRSKICFKANIETLLLARGIMNHIDNGSLNTIMHKANEIVGQYYPAPQTDNES